jgi:hypothetical protein
MMRVMTIQAGIHAVLYQDNTQAIRDIERVLAL